MDIQELREKLEGMPTRYAAALAEQRACVRTAADVEVEVDALAEEGQKPLESSKLRKLERDVERLDLAIAQKEGELDIAIRSMEAPPFKLTETAVHSYVRSNAEVVMLKQRRIDTRYEIDELRGVSSRYGLHRTQEAVAPPSEQLLRLERKLEEARARESEADDAVASLKVELETLKALVELFSSGLLA